MMSFTSNIVALFLLVTLHLATVSGSALPLDLSPRGYEIVVPKWKISHRSEDFEVHGTVEEVHSYMKARFPDYEPISYPDASELERRAPITPPLCVPVPGQPWGAIQWADTGALVNTVGGMIGTLVLNAGCCTRIYCNDWDTAWVCNENSPNLGILPVDITAGLQALVNDCTSCLNGDKGGLCLKFTGGQVFDGDGFNVIISSGDCNDIAGGNDKRDESKQLARRAPGELARHDNPKVLPPHCQPGNPHGWPWAFGDEVATGINELNSQGLLDFLPAGHTCVSVWCGQSASIWLCNDNNDYYPVLAATVADYAATIGNDCNLDIFGGNHLVGGQLFSTDNFNVIVKGTSNNKNCDGDHL